MLKLHILLFVKHLKNKKKQLTNKEKNKYQTLEVLKPNTQILTIKDVIAESTLSEEAKNKLNEMKEIEKTVDREKLYYRTNEYTIDFPNF